MSGSGSNDERRNKEAIDPDISLEHTISTINSLPDDTMNSLSFDADEQKKERKRRKLQKRDSSESKRNKSVLHTHPLNQTSATESSKRLTKALKEIYKNDVLPLEQKFNLYNFCLPTNAGIQDSEFDAKPMVLR